MNLFLIAAAIGALILGGAAIWFRVDKWLPALIYDAFTAALPDIRAVLKWLFRSSGDVRQRTREGLDHVQDPRKRDEKR